MKEFHSSDYIDFLSRITPENMHEFAASMSKFGIGEFSDCPVFSGLYDYCRIHAGASIGEFPADDQAPLSAAPEGNVPGCCTTS